MEFDYDLFKDILIVSIPLVGGAITAKWISQSWQQRKEKNEIRMKVIEKFTQSFAKKYSLLGEFTGLVYNSYVDPKLTVVNTDGTLKNHFKFPKLDSEKPFNKYSEQWKEFEKTYWELSYPSNDFLTNFRFYFNEPEINDEIGDSMKMMNAVFHRVKLFLHSDDLSEFQRWYADIHKRLDDVLPLLYSIETGLISKNLIVR
jgi:hypothetical protein